MSLKMAIFFSNSIRDILNWCFLLPLLSTGIFIKAIVFHSSICPESLYCRLIKWIVRFFDLSHSSTRVTVSQCVLFPLSLFILAKKLRREKKLVRKIIILLLADFLRFSDCLMQWLQHTTNQLKKNFNYWIECKAYLKTVLSIKIHQ